MKVKNLLLAGLAVAAMTACSNNDEIVENGIQTTGEEASMQINLKFADQGTRAVSGEPDEGADFERESSTVTAIIVYPNSTKNKVYKNLTLVEGSNKTYKTEAFSVEAANGVNVYAIINYDADKANALAATANLTELTVGAQSLPDKGLAYIAETVAKENAFLMSGSTAEPIDIEAGSTTNVAPITVDRVAAKFIIQPARQYLLSLRDSLSLTYQAILIYSVVKQVHQVGYNNIYLQQEQLLMLLIDGLLKESLTV